VAASIARTAAAASAMIEVKSDIRDASGRARGAEKCGPGDTLKVPLVLAVRRRAVYHIAAAGEAAIRHLLPLKAPVAPGDRFMSGPVVLESLDLAALLCSRVCHDLISPVGAIVNGLEVLEDDNDETTKTFALELIKKSARTASARLQFCRLAFGAAGSAGAQIDLGDAEAVARGFLEDDKTKIRWNLARILLGKNRIKLLLNLLVLAGQTIPRGGTLTVDPIGEGDQMGFRVTAAGLNSRIPQAMQGLLAGEPAEQTVDAHAIQPFYAGMLARACGLKIAIAAEGDGVLVTAGPG
jgi:histidine phosphotransferase ChpT